MQNPQIPETTSRDSLIFIARADCNPPMYTIDAGDDVGAKVAALNEALPWTVSLLRTFTGSLGLLARVRARFANKLHRGRWYALDDEDLAWLLALQPVSRARLACQWVAELEPSPRRAAIVAGLLFDTFDMSEADVSDLMGAWLQDPELGARATAVAVKRGRHQATPDEARDRERLRTWMTSCIAADDGDDGWMFTVGMAMSQGLGLEANKANELYTRDLLLALNAHSIGRVRYRGSQQRWWRVPEELAGSGHNNDKGP